MIGSSDAVLETVWEGLMDEELPNHADLISKVQRSQTEVRT